MAVLNRSSEEPAARSALAPLACGAEYVTAENLPGTVELTSLSSIIVFLPETADIVNLIVNKLCCGSVRIPVIVLADEPSASEIVKLYRSGATDVILRDEWPSLHEAIDTRCRERADFSFDSCGLFKVLADQTSSGIGVLQDDKIVYCNQAGANIIGRSVEDICSNDFWLPVHPDHVEMVKRRARSRLKGEPQPDRYDLKLLTPNGEVRWIDLSTTVIDYNGSAATLCSFTDITARRNAEKALADSLFLLRLMAENIDQAFFIADPKKFCFLYVNPGFEKLWECSAEAALADPEAVLGRILPDDLPFVLAQAEELKTNTVRFDFRLVFPDGRMKWIHSSTSPVNAWSEAHVLLVGINSDITAEKQAQEDLRLLNQNLERMVAERTGRLENLVDELHAEIYQRELLAAQLRSSENRYRAILEEQSDMVLRCLPDFTLTYVNPAFCRHFGKTQAELLGSSALNLLIEEDREELLRLASLSQYEPPVGLVQFRDYDCDGKLRWTQWFGQVIWGPDGEALEYQATGRDITEIKAAQLALEESEQRYRQLVEQNLIGIIIIQDGKYVYANPGFAQMMGYTVDELLSLDSIERTIPPDRWKRAQETIENVIEGKETSRYHSGLGVRKDGSIIHIETWGVRSTFNGRPSFTAAIVDTTQRELARQALQNSEARYRGIVESQLDFVVRTTMDGRITYANEACCKLMGMTADALCGLRLQDFMHPESRERFNDALSALEKPPHRSSAEGRVKTSRGWRWIQWSHSVIFGDDRTAPEMQGTGRDITEQKRAEQQAQERAHELSVLNTLLMSLTGSSDDTDLISSLSRVLQETTGADSGALSRFGGVGPIRGWVSWEFPVSVIRSYKRAFKVICHVDEARQTGLAVPIKNLRKSALAVDGGFAKAIPDWKTGVTIPLISRGDFLGALVLLDLKARKRTRRELDFLGAIGRQIGSSLHNCYLFEENAVEKVKFQTLSRRFVRLQEEERASLSRELHDEIGQMLTGLKLTMEAAEKYRCDSRLAEAIGQVNEITDKIRSISLDLRPGMLDDLGLAATLEWYLNRYTQQTGVSVKLKNDVQGRRFSRDIETTAYRIVQEALTNVARHSGVKKARVVLRIAERRLFVEVIDNGCGFNTNRIELGNNTAGITSMQERATLSGGVLAISSAIGKGTLIRAKLPLEIESV